jgi:hypothetical protein
MRAETAELDLCPPFRERSSVTATTTEADSTGEELFSGMASGRAWWKLQAMDIAPWIRSLPASVRTNKLNRLEWIGRPWDGTSDITLGEEPWDGRSDTDFSEPFWEPTDDSTWMIASGADLALLVTEICRLLVELPTLGVTFPDHTNVRACLIGPPGDISDPTSAGLTIDFDFGDFVFPLSIRDWQLRSDISPSLPQVAALMVRKLIHAAKHRKRILRRELLMRDAFETIVAEIGGGAAPLWLRLEPMRFDAVDDDLTRLPYVAFYIGLDRHQIWAPHGVEEVKTVAELTKRYHGTAAGHRRRVARLAEMRASGSAGWISDIALGLIREHGLHPGDVYRQERDAALHLRKRTNFGDGGRFEILLCFDGLLQPYLHFESGEYEHGKLILRGVFPATLASAAVGRPLAAFVDHPAFISSRAVVDRAEWQEDRLILYHTPELVTVEEAERLFAEASPASGGSW